MEIQDKQKKVIFLDRDGTIIKDGSAFWEEPHFVDHAKEGIGMLYTLGYELVIVTNQCHIAKGHSTFEHFNSVNKWITDSLLPHGINFLAFYVCPHHPEGNIPELTKVCDCRKPLPGMLLQAAKEHNIDLKESIMIGDSYSDVIAGLRAGCTPILLTDKFGQEPKWHKDAEFWTAPDLKAAALIAGLPNRELIDKDKNISSDLYKLLP